jgi:hypothetical protein
MIRSNANFQLRVGANSQANALMYWGNTGPSDPVGAFAIPGCPGKEDTWLVYPGGLWTLEAQCVDLVVETKAGADQMQVAIGDIQC